VLKKIVHAHLGRILMKLVIVHQFVIQIHHNLVYRGKQHVVVALVERTIIRVLVLIFAHKTIMCSMIV